MQTSSPEKRKLASDVLEGYEMYFKEQNYNHPLKENVQEESGVKVKYLYSVDQQIC